MKKRGQLYRMKKGAKNSHTDRMRAQRVNRGRAQCVSVVRTQWIRQMGVCCPDHTNSLASFVPSSPISFSAAKTLGGGVDAPGPARSYEGTRVFSEG